MPHVPARPIEEVSFLTPILEKTRQHLGFAPNSLLTMAHMPHMALAFGLLMATIRGGDLKEAYRQIADLIPPLEASRHVDPAVLQLAAYAASIAAGCRYCQSHTAHALEKMADANPKIETILEYETSQEFSDAERAVVDLAMAAARAPNAAERHHFDTLRKHFSNAQIVQIVGIIALFGFLNRWNDTLATELESVPQEYAAAALRNLAWSPGKHAGGGRHGGRAK